MHNKWFSFGVTSWWRNGGSTYVKETVRNLDGNSPQEQ